MSRSGGGFVPPGGSRMKPPIAKTRPAGAGKGAETAVYAPPTPKVSRQKRAKVLTPAERAAFLASRPDLKPQD
jgi:hypothetical protein